ncbi:uncharacterized protein DS421_7g200570 [Arachis hypogaea]|nr:uncharacterized protein DS421_7g200570 [Arachis hypogaea]
MHYKQLFFFFLHENEFFAKFEDNGTLEIHPNDYRNTLKRLQKYTQTIIEIHPKDYRNTPKGFKKYTQNSLKYTLCIIHNSFSFSSSSSASSSSSLKTISEIDVKK